MTVSYPLNRAVLRRPLAGVSPEPRSRNHRSSVSARLVRIEAALYTSCPSRPVTAGQRRGVGPMTVIDATAIRMGSRRTQHND